MIERRSAEEWLAEFEDTVRRYHLGKAAPASERLTQEEALARLRAPLAASHPEVVG